MNDPENPKHPNRLASATSPYLLQHAHNPVDWYPWGPEAFERAEREDRPILLSIGYAACHWCHVMERESFENEAVARLMNENFVCIKVDREERPDVDEIYMAATVAMSGSGGWPMTVFCAPDRRPFFAGTYFPPSDRYGRPGFATVLRRIAELWKNDRQKLVDQAGELTEHVRASATPVRPMPVDESAIARAVRQLGASFDERFGGFASAPKFPPCASLSLLMRFASHASVSRDPATGPARSSDASPVEPTPLEMVTRTLDAMKNGGIYDHVGGGFARYSTDERWLVPHFEKMLYDNAALARVYLEAFQVTGDLEYRRVASETLDYVLKEMQAPEGGFYSATDADSEGEEGKFFVWQPEQIDAVLEPAEAEAFKRYYDVTSAGNWEGKSIVNTPRPLADVAGELGVRADELRASLERARAKVYAAREKRVHPLLDDKILTSWNGLMIGALAEGAHVLGERRYLQAAERAANYALEKMRRPDGGLFRTARGGVAHLDAVLEDYAYLADALVDVYEAGGAESFLQEARALVDRLRVDFSDAEDGAFFHTAAGHEALLVRMREGHDGALPNANAVAARALARLSVHFDRPDYRDAALAAIRAYGRLIERAPRAFATALGVVDFSLEGPLELVLAGEPESAEYIALARAVAEQYLPNRVVGHVGPQDAKSDLPLIAGKGPVDGHAALFVCENFACQAPITDPSAVGKALCAGRARLARERRTNLGTRSLAGRGTPGATAGYAQRFESRHGAGGYRELGRTELRISRLGFGGYRVDDADPDHRAALEQALREGVNLIDTSTNYTDGRSERLIGEVLADLSRREDLTRDQVVVVSKIGYLQGEKLERAKEREAKGQPFVEMVKVSDDVWHSMHPAWLEAELERSLERLGLETLDVGLVHNPEYFFSDAVQRGQGPLTQLRDEFYARLERAFRHFEAEVRRGRLGAYGVSSNTLVAPADSREATSLARMLEAARRAGGDAHHFRVVQFPMNLLEAGALVEQNNDGRSVLELAREAGLGVLVNRPLNAIAGDALFRLADPPSVEAPAWDEALGRVASLEQEFRRDLAPALTPRPGSAPPEALFTWADQLGQLPARLASLEQWRDIEAQVVAPRVTHAVQMLDRALGSDAWRAWRGRYLNALEALLAAVAGRAADRNRARTRALREAIDPLLPEARRGASLSQKALFALESVPGVSSVLCGMRAPSYVADAVATLGWKPIERVQAVFEAALKTQE